MSSAEIGVNVAWVLQCAYMVFLGRVGLVIRELGMVRLKNAQAVIHRHVLDICVVSIIWWFTSYAFAFGAETGWFLGKTNFATSKFEDSGFLPADYVNWVYQWSLATLASGIVLGPVSERITLPALIFHNLVFIGWTYPIIIHWCRYGWLADLGYVDQSGGGIVLMTAGWSGLFATMMVGARIDRFNPQYQQHFKYSNIPLMMFGSLMLWFGLLGFNSGSPYSIINYDSTRVPMIGLNTILAAGTGGITASTLHYVFNMGTTMRFSNHYLIGGALAGIAAISTGCASVSPWAAWLYGWMAGPLFLLVSKLYIRIKLDDPTDSIAIFGFGGMMGLIATSFLDTTYGVFYGGGNVLGINVLAIVTIFGWTGVHTIFTLGIMKFMNMLRESAPVEMMGLDQAYYGGSVDQTKVAQYGRMEEMQHQGTEISNNAKAGQDQHHQHA